ncbi:DUF4276 family protein [Comamonas nitrativorans]|uniref:DUF4276 family protein n=1 Tax=Comamonas nitrativorans TaxID=108437 RepID=A0ABV9GUZ3_9BURK
MSKELVFLLEERSAEALLKSLLPRFLDRNIVPRLIPFEGKQDLEKQLIRRIRGYQNPNARFIVMRDQDSHQDCIALKQRLLDLCVQSGKSAACLIRIACTELETFYLADLAAVETALEIHGIAKQQGSRKFRSPDHLGSPSRELKALTHGQYQKIASSREIGKHLDLGNTRSASFHNFLSGIRRMEAELLA